PDLPADVRPSVLHRRELTSSPARSAMLVYAADQPELPPLEMPDRFRHEITYFMTPSGVSGVPPLPAGEYWIRLCDARSCLDDGVVRIVSPLDSDSKAEIELSEEQEAWLEWMVAHEVEHVRIEGGRSF
ncbi:MAG TPA: hypothetical protein VL475_04550, partial [Planctomycetaceae bacterium]|nr:hypothetical protein [Planctomycetaceae bacterium]